MPELVAGALRNTARPSSEDVAEMFRDAFTIIRRRQRTLLERSGLSLTEWSGLHMSAQHGARAREIADAIGLTPAGATDLIDRLEGRGLIRRTRDPEDRRAIRIELTDAGRRLHRETKRQMMHFFAVTLEQLSPKEYDALATGLRALVRAEDSPEARSAAGV
jgi:DNA-binding MarR family transcriptional regulator